MPSRIQHNKSVASSTGRAYSSIRDMRYFLYRLSVKPFSKQHKQAHRHKRWYATEQEAQLAAERKHNHVVEAYPCTASTPIHWHVGGVYPDDVITPDKQEADCAS